MRKRTRVAATVRPGGAERVPVLAAGASTERPGSQTPTERSALH